VDALSAHDIACENDAVFPGSTSLLLDDTGKDDAVLEVAWCLLRRSCHYSEYCGEVGVVGKERVRIGLEIICSV